MLLHVHGTQSLRLVDKRPLLRLREQLPLGAETLRDLRVVHLGVLLGHLAPLAPRPHHEGVHGPLHALSGRVGGGGAALGVGGAVCGGVVDGACVVVVVVGVVGGGRGHVGLRRRVGAHAPHGGEGGRGERGAEGGER